MQVENNAAHLSQYVHKTCDAVEGGDLSSTVFAMRNSECFEAQQVDNWLHHSE